ncbi:MAG: redox-regulated ATPase YchF [Candidatus Eisenbacteria bacterium]|uniref:Redox-regulated ATPase YchF n=1 Tax=Eiseniibacteriota bacterium TaxID=2212470 RepID=A0A849SMX7_UNCEI|nr:redox-regulated ATPase YchF [Candidatus Eisenbacteria bacterium]
MKRVGILGLSQSGKSTLFQILLTASGAAASSQGREQIGMVQVPDERVDRLSALYKPKKTTYTQIQFVDTVAAGGQSARSAAKGTDLFAGVRNCDALVAVVRDFEDPAVPAEAGVDAARDLRTLDTELAFNDLAICETRIERIEKELRIGKKQAEAEHAALLRCRALLEQERPLREAEITEDDLKLLRGFQFMTLKPLLVVYNQDDASDRKPPAPGPGAGAVALRAHLEREIVSLPAADRPSFRAELGATEDGLSLVIRACYELLGLLSFFTVGPDEVRAWTVQKGDTAVDAAGEIHSDLAKGFIRAETIPWDKLLEAGGHSQARDKGWLRLEGREYRVQDGDCFEIRFNK